MSQSKSVAVQIIDELMRLTDRSNWPDNLEHARFSGYEDAMEAVTEVLNNYQSAAYEENRRIKE